MKRIIISLLGICALLSSCVTTDPIDNCWCEVSYIKNTLDEPILLKSKFYSFDEKGDTVLTTYKDSIFRVEVSQIAMIMDYVPVAKLEIYSVVDTSLLITETFDMFGTPLNGKLSKGNGNEVDGAKKVVYVRPEKGYEPLGIESSKYEVDAIQWDYYPILVSGGLGGHNHFRDNLTSMEYIQTRFDLTCPGYALIEYYEINK